MTTDMQPPEGGWKYIAYVVKPNGKHVDVTPHLAAMYDMLIDANAVASSHFSTEELRQVLEVGRLCKFEIPKCGDSSPHYHVNPGSSSPTYQALCDLDVDHIDDHSGDVVILHRDGFNMSSERYPDARLTWSRNRVSGRREVAFIPPIEST